MDFCFLFISSPPYRSHHFTCPQTLIAFTNQNPTTIHFLGHGWGNLINSRRAHKFKKQFNENKKYFARFSELSPCKESENSSSQSNDEMADKSKRSDTSSGYGSSTSSAFSRLRYNLSPVSSYYKPLMRTFGKRDDTPPKVSII